MTEQKMEIIKTLGSDKDDTKHIKLYHVAHARQVAVGIAAMKDWERDVVADFLDILAINMEPGVSHIGWTEMQSIADLVRTGSDIGAILIGEPWLSNRKLDQTQLLTLNSSLMRHCFAFYSLAKLKENGFPYSDEKVVVKSLREMDVDVLRALSVALFKISSEDERAKRILKNVDYVLACLGHRDSIASMATYISESIARLDAEDGRFDEEISRRARLVKNWTRLSLAYVRNAADPFLEASRKIKETNIDMLSLGGAGSMVPSQENIVFPSVEEHDLPVPASLRRFLSLSVVRGEPSRPQPSQLIKIASRKRAKLMRWTETDVAASMASSTSEFPHTAILLDRIGGDEIDNAATIRSTYSFLLEPLPLVTSEVDPDQVYSTLQAEFPWMRELNVAAARATSMSLRRSMPFWKMQPTVVVGPPGMGKTRWLRRLTELVGIGSHSISVAGIEYDMAIRGMERGWKNARPSFPVLGFDKCRLANPILLIDEVDKTAKPEVMDSMIPMLEPETARCYPDQFLFGNLDLGYATFLFSANDISRLSSVIKSRLSVANVRTPTQEELVRVAHVIVNEEAKDHGLSPSETDEVMDAVRSGMSRPAEPIPNLRSVQRLVAGTIGDVLWVPPGPRLVQ
jgi:hypothetical protein